MFARIQLGVPVEWTLSLRQFLDRNPTISFPSNNITQDDLPDGWVIVNPTDRPNITIYQNVSEQTPVNTDGTWSQSWLVSDKSDVEKISIAMNLKFLEIANNYTAKINGGFPYQNNVYDIDDTAQSNMTRVQTAFLVGIANAHGGYWRTKDNQNVAMTDSEVSTFFQAAFVWKLTLIHTRQVKSTSLIALTSFDDIVAFDTSLDF